MTPLCPTIQEWFAGKDILITGGTGFLGKGLIEKLLRACPDLNRIYLIVRPKKGRSVDERKKILFEDELFSKLLELHPDALDKVACLPGDVSELECGLSKQHQREVIQNVSIVFHGAASVHFDDALIAALRLNTRGTLELIKLSKQMKKLEVFQYISTTHCNVNLENTIEEKVYPSHLPWQDLLGSMMSDDDTLNSIAMKVIGTHPNTYTFTKSLSENIVNDASDDIPTVIVRPSAVMPTLKEPIPGWIDNLNGPVSITSGLCKGALRVIKMDPEGVLDFVPLDISINGLIVGAWARRFVLNNQGTVVFNQVHGKEYNRTNQQFVDDTRMFNELDPIGNSIWYPFIILTTSSSCFNILFFFLQILPAFFVDFLLFVRGKKTIMLKLNVKIYNAIMALSSYTTKSLNFTTYNYPSLDDRLGPEDKKNFPILAKYIPVNASEYTKNAIRGMRIYLFKEKDEDLAQKRKNLKRLKIIHYGTIITTSLLVVWKFTLCLGDLVVEFVASAIKDDL